MEMSCDSALALPECPIIVGFGGVGVDILAAVPSFPKPDSKNRTTDLKVQGGGNTGNALTCAARLGLKPRIISKVASDTQGRALLEELEADGVDTSFLVVSKEGNTPFSYVIVDTQTKTRTCILTEGYPPMVPEDLPRASLLSALDGAKVVYFDVRMPESALVIAQEAFRQNISILIDAERLREGLNDLLEFADYVVCSEKFPQASNSYHHEVEYHIKLGICESSISLQLGRYAVLFFDSNISSVDHEKYFANSKILAVSCSQKNDLGKLFAACNKMEICNNEFLLSNM